jgi:hypothetical protein
MRSRPVGILIAEPVLVPTDSGNSPGFLVYANDELICLVVRIDKIGDAHVGRWQVPWGTGPCSGHTPPPAEYLDEVVGWIAQRCAGSMICTDRIEEIAAEMEQATITLMTCAAR